MSVDNSKRDLLVQSRHILRWRGVRGGQGGSGGAATSLPVNNSEQDRTVAGWLIINTAPGLTIITSDISDGWAQGSPLARSTSAEEKILNKTTDWWSQWFTLIWADHHSSSASLGRRSRRFLPRSQGVTEDSRSIYGNFLVNIILTEKSPQGGTCQPSSDDTDQYLLTAGSGETSILYMVNQCHASS